jgi:Domain of unknown function (DUF6377)
MKFINFISILLFLLNTQNAITFGQSDTKALLSELNDAIKNKDKYITEKLERIDKLKAKINEGQLPLDEQFQVYDKLFNEYKTFQYTEAFNYALKLQKIALQLNNPIKINYAKLQVGFTLLSSGMYKESLDSLNTIKLTNMPNSIKSEYFMLMARCNYELATYNDAPYYLKLYNKKGNINTDSAIALIGKENLQYFFLKGIKELKEKNFEKAKSDFNLIIDKFHPDDREYAMTASALASVYMENGDKKFATDLMIKAAIADIKSSTKEGVALAYVADLLYNEKHDEVNAYSYVKEAMKDASFYGAKLRLKYVSSIFPIIEGNRLSTIEAQKNRLLVFTIAISLLSLLVLIFAYIIFKQLKKLRQAEKIVIEANAKLKDVNHQLKASNKTLQLTNNELLEANKIKEEYIGYSFNMYATYLDKIDKIKKNISKRLQTKNLENVSQALESIDMGKEREALYLSFDKVFIKLFPNFIPTFNSFFKEEDRYLLKEGQPLNFDIRIFALIRIGISDHEQIAKILEYSVRTVYNHKTAVKNKSLFSNDEFENEIMKIRAFGNTL